jgi:hypothetical protein
LLPVSLKPVGSNKMLHQYDGLSLNTVENEMVKQVLLATFVHIEGKIIKSSF